MRFSHLAVCLAFALALTLSMPTAVASAGGRSTAPAYQDVVVFSRPLNINPLGLVVPMSPEIKSGTLGYYNHGIRYGAPSSGYPYTVDGVDQYWYDSWGVAFTSTFTTTQSGFSIYDSKNRGTYAFPGWTVVRVNGVDVPLDSDAGRAALAAPGVKWACDYRLHGNGVAWCIVRYRPASK